MLNFLTELDSLGKGQLFAEVYCAEKNNKTVFRTSSIAWYVMFKSNTR